MNERPSSEFDWAVYVDATFAGLSLLIPIPLLDIAFESFFRRRMPRSIAARHDGRPAPEALKAINRGRFGLSCLTLPISLVLLFLKRLYRTVLYVLTIKDATDRLSHYWHRAFLIDYSLRRGHLDPSADWQSAVAAIHRVLDEEIETSPLKGLAARVVSDSRHVLRTVVRWTRQRFEDDVARQARDTLRRRWADTQEYLVRVAESYERLREANRSAATR